MIEKIKRKIKDFTQTNLTLSLSYQSVIKILDYFEINIDKPHYHFHHEDLDQQ